jgi:hypothetical protein
MPRGAFSSAKLQTDGTVEVTGDFTPKPDDPKKDSFVAFYLVQGPPGAETKVDGEGRWLAGQPVWTGTGKSGLKPGSARGTAMVIIAQDEPPAFVTVSWNSPVEVTAAD